MSLLEPIVGQSSVALSSEVSAAMTVGELAHGAGHNRVLTAALQLACGCPHCLCAWTEHSAAAKRADIERMRRWRPPLCLPPPCLPHGRKLLTSAPRPQ